VPEKEQDCGRCNGVGSIREDGKGVTCPRCHGAKRVPLSWNDPADQQDPDRRKP
jgi:DnaJ-class molecular chaperone